MIRTILAGAAAITLVTGFARAETPPAPPATRAHAMDGSATCPMDVNGAKLTTAPTSTGVNMTFSTSSPELVTDLQQLQAAVAARVQRMQQGGCGPVAAR